MLPFTLYHENNVMTISSKIKIDSIIKICSHQNQIFLLSKNHDLHCGKFNNNSNYDIEFDILQNKIVDIDLYDKILYTVDEDGNVFKTSIENLQDWMEIPIYESISTDTGQKKRAHISKIKSNSFGTIYVTINQELYGCGNFGILNSEDPIKLECFSGLKVCGISAGCDFFIVLTHRGEQVLFEEEEDDFSSCSSMDIFKDEINKKVFEIDSKMNISDNSLLSRSSTLEYEFQDDDDDDDVGNCSFSSGESYLTRHNCNSHKRDTLKNIISKGNNLVQTNVWSFGCRNDGQLGIGDHVKRSGLNSVLNLTGIGIYTVCCGTEHTVARTIDGRVFQWGSNNRRQIDQNDLTKDISAPKEVIAEEHFLEGICAHYKTVLLGNDLNLTEICKDVPKRNFIVSKPKMRSANYENNCPTIFTSENFFLQNHNAFLTDYQSIFTTMQTETRSCINNLKYVKFLRKNIRKLNFSNEVDQLCQHYIKLTYVLTLNLERTEQFYRQNIDFYKLLFIKNVKELKEVFEKYTKHYCNILAVNSFSEIAKTCEKLKCNIHLVKDINNVFYNPFNLITCIIEFLELLIKQLDGSQELNTKLLQWKKIWNNKHGDITLASNTQKFWQKYDKTSPLNKFKQISRRVILNSAEVPLRLVDSSFSTNLFVLFSDCLCYYNNQVNLYPLTIVWVQMVQATLLKIVTPEREFLVVPKEQKNLWYDNLVKLINNALGKPSGRISSMRTAGYIFSEKHSKYPGVRCYGVWNSGLMHGICHLEYPDGKIYYGEMRTGEIEGQGQMLIPSVGMYDGSFKAGKFNGHGVYEMVNNEVYEGSFKDGFFHGHGCLRTNQYTYVGDFVNNVKCGYGVLDDNTTDDKYMGIFTNNKKTGSGICIRMNGDYFEGAFLNDSFNGEGVAVLENGSYYEGELTLNGPKGKGCFYFPQTQIRKDNHQDDKDVLMIGSVLTGYLSGAWDDIKIVNGSFALNQQFPKLPRTIGQFAVDNERKWCSLFRDWEEQIFGCKSIPGSKFIWDKIAIYMTKEKNKHKQKDTECSKFNKYFMKNIVLQLNQFDIKNSSSLDKISLKSTSSLYSRRSTLDLATKRKSYSNESLFDLIKDLKMLDECQRNVEEKHSQNDNFKLPALDYIPSYGRETLTQNDFHLIKEYLSQAFKDPVHPLYLLNQSISNCFYSSYGCWKIKPSPILSSQAMHEWESLSMRIYEIIQKMFPALPSTCLHIENEVVSHISLLYPIVMTEGVYSTLFVLYANKYSEKDEVYRQRVQECAKMTDEQIVEFLNWDSSTYSIIHDDKFREAVSNFKLITEKYCPREMLNVIQTTMQLIELARTSSLDKSVILGADNIMPLAIYIVLRASVSHLGAELALLEDLMGTDYDKEMSGLSGYCYTTIQAAYQHIISEKFFQK